MTAILSAHNLELRYPRTSRPTVSGASLELNAGDALGLVGESGSGKTTIARALVGSLEPASGDVLVDGRLWRSIKQRDPLRRKVQMVFQDPYDSLNPLLTPRQTIAEVFRVQGRLNRQDSRKRAEALLAEVGLRGEAIDRRPKNLSGGQRQRVGIARALACDPAVIIADEPTSSLDVSVQAQILNLLADLRAERHLALVIVSHDLAVVRHMTDRTLVIYGGRIVERGPTRELFDTPAHPYTRVLVDSSPDRSGGTRLAVNPSVSPTGDGCVFASRCSLMQTDCLAEHPPETALGGRAVCCYHPLLLRIPDGEVVA